MRGHHPGDAVPTKEERRRPEAGESPAPSTPDPGGDELVEAIEQLIATIDPDVEVELCPTEPMDYPPSQVPSRDVLAKRPRVSPLPAEPFVSTPERKSPAAHQNAAAQVQKKKGAPEPGSARDLAALPPPRRVPRVAKASRPSREVPARRSGPPPLPRAPRPSAPLDSGSSLGFESVVEIVEDSLVDTEVVEPYEDEAQSVTAR